MGDILATVGGSSPTPLLVSMTRLPTDRHERQHPSRLTVSVAAQLIDVARVVPAGNTSVPLLLGVNSPPVRVENSHVAIVLVTPPVNGGWVNVQPVWTCDAVVHWPGAVGEL